MDITRTPAYELDELQLVVRQEVELMHAILEEAEFSWEQRMISLETCELCRLENEGRVRERREYR